MNDNKKIAVNSIVMFVRFCVVTIIGLIRSRVVLDALGASDYGLYNVVGGIVALLNVFNTAMTTTTYRFIAFELGKKEDGQLNKAFNTVFLIHACFAFVILVLGFSLGFWYINNYLNVAPGKLPDARFVFTISIFTTALSTLMVPYRGLLTAYERFTANAVIDIVSDTIKLVLILCFVYSDRSRIRIYSIIMAVYVLITNGSFFIYCLKEFFSVIKFRVYKEWRLLKEILSFTWWILIGASASVAETQGTSIVVNYFFGTIVNASFAVAHTVKNYISVFSRNLSKVAIPQITKSFSGGNLNRSISLSCYISKYTCLLMLVAAFPVLMEMDFLLDIWLKDVPEKASGKIKAFQLVQSAFSLFGLPIAYFAYKLGAEPSAVLVIYLCIYFVNVFVRLYLIKRVLGYGVKPFFTISYLRVFLIGIPLLIAFLIYNPCRFSLWGHIAGMAFCELYLLLDVWLLGLEKQEKTIIKGLFNRYIILKMKK